MSTYNLVTCQPTLGRRREARLRVRLEACLVTLDGTARMVIADISRNGAQLSGQLGRLRIGQQAVIQWGGGFEAFGTIAWLEGDHCGMKFEEPITQQALIDTRRQNDSRPLGSEREQARQAARAFVQGRMRL